MLVRFAGATILADPIWGRAVVVPRLAAAAPELDRLPPLDGVVVSHAHYDHLSMPTLRRLARRHPAARAVVPLGLGGHLARAGFRDVVERDWWESTRVGSAEVTLVPARHWARRGPFDLHRTLWGGFVLAAERRVWFAGDTALFEGMREIGERCGPLDAAVLPIGAYAPEWFMRRQHLSPEDAGKGFLLSGARTLVSMHWGTFSLSDEDSDEPPARLRGWWERHRPDGRQLAIPAIGETIRL